MASVLRNDLSVFISHTTQVNGDLGRGKDSELLVDNEVLFDGGILHYRLEGCPDPASPVLVFSNAFLTSLHIWDSAIILLKDQFPGFRFLRYDTRGYHPNSLGDTEPITLDVLSADIANLLDILEIPRVEAVIGVKFGGVIALAFASRFADRLENLIVCGCEVAASKESEHACDETLRYVRTWGMNSVLKDKCVARWFTADSRELPHWKQVRDMVAAMDHNGLEATIRAQYGYDERENSKKIQVPTLFLTGSDDGVLPETMSRYPEMMGGSAVYNEINRASGLPMMETPAAFVETITSFLRLGDDS